MEQQQLWPILTGSWIDLTTLTPSGLEPTLMQPLMNGHGPSQKRTLMVNIETYCQRNRRTTFGFAQISPSGTTMKPTLDASHLDVHLQMALC